MKTSKKTVSYMSVMLLLLTVALGSCEQELPEGKRSGAIVPVKINLLGLTEGGSEELRHSGPTNAPVETVIQPLGDGLLLEMSIEPDWRALRDGVPPQAMDNGRKYRVIAVKNGTGDGYLDGELISYGDFTIGASDNPELQIPAGVSCHYYCMSHNETGDMATPSGGYVVGNVPNVLPVNNDKDFLLWKNPVARTIAADETDPTLTIQLAQALTKVKLVIESNRSDMQIKTLTDITLNAQAISGSFVHTGGGSLNPGATTANPAFTWSGASAQSRTSDGLRIFPKASAVVSLTIPANKITLSTDNTLPLVGKTFTFSSIALESGKSYTIRVKLRYAKFASSNIYWDETTDPSNPKLTFKPYDPTPGVAGHYPTEQKYQGVFFKWGSLIGISPAAVLSTDPLLQYPNYFYSGESANPTTTGTPIYVPTYTAGPPASSTWTKTNVSAFTASSTIPMVPDNSQGSDAWGPVPYADNTTYVVQSGINNNRGSQELTDLGTQHYANYVGDICLYISETQNLITEGKYYRMPHSEEFGLMGGTWDLVTNIRGAWRLLSSDIPITSNSMLPDGTYTGILTGAYHNPAVPAGSDADNFFPHSGFRHGDNGFLNGVGGPGSYWSGSVYSADGGYDMYFGGITMHTNYYHPRSFGVTVRCVLQE
ncbi:MAG: hypothetical protein LBS46_02715 [Dysgonamonadaceae bacterium]|jgi:hypothetical protein|nr:hypothetical protein [Dysgonamonadaceae bacterium]